MKKFNEWLTDYIACKVLLEYYSIKTWYSKSAGRWSRSKLNNAWSNLEDLVFYKEEYRRVLAIIDLINNYGYNFRNDYEKDDTLGEGALIHAYFSGWEIKEHLVEVLTKHTNPDWVFSSEEVTEILQ